MGRKGLVVFVVWCLLAAFAAGSALAAGMTAEQRKAADERARVVLKAQEWVINLTPEDGRGAAETDVITFTQEDKISSRNLLAKGYGDSNFRLTVEEDGTIIWETMKVDKDKNLAFLRGELRGGQMIGGVSTKSTKGAISSYVYTTGAVAKKGKI